MSEQLSLNPNDTIGILGGGQLGRMLALAAARLGLKTHIYCPDAESPAFHVAESVTIADYTDVNALEEFAKSVQVVTFEFENVPVDTAEFLEQITIVRPAKKALAIAQDRLHEKEFLTNLDISVAPYASISEIGDFKSAIDKVGLPAILKSRRFGYDGKGQVLIEDRNDLEEKWQSIGRVPAVLEQKLDFQAECSVVLARGLGNSIQAYDLAENVHQNHILKTSTVPVTCINATECIKAAEIGEKICRDLNYIGVLAVELFVVAQQGKKKLIVNEIAPRVHNSGHWTEDACHVSQFEQHIRAVAGWSLGNARRFSDIRMENLIGDEVCDWEKLITSSDAHIHLYGKSQIKPGRKMGHVNHIIK